MIATAEQPKTLTLREWWLAKTRAECIDEEQWLQEYCCVPADESTAFISFEMIANCEQPGLTLMSVDQLINFLGVVGPHERHPFYMGVDVARHKDLFVIDVGEKIGDVVWDRVRLELLDKTFAEMKFELWRLLKLPQVKRCCIDATGMGEQMAEEARTDFGWKVEPIKFTADVKSELAFGIRKDFEDQKLRLVRDDKLKADIRGIKKEVTLSGNIRFSGEAADSHCDRFWAKALRQQASRQKVELGALVG